MKIQTNKICRRGKKYSGKTCKNTEQSFKIFLLISLGIDTHREGLIILT